jgi:cyanate permease
MTSPSVTYSRVQRPRIFYGWTIVAVGFLSYVVCAFHMSSTLSVFLKPLTKDLHVSRGLFSLLRSGEIVSLGTVHGLGILISHTIGAAGAPFFGFLHDVTGSYMSSFVMFVIAIVISAFLILLVRAPEK